MENRQTKYFASSFAWGVISKVVDALVKFMTIPLLLNYFGKENYGILTLAIATNAYMGLLNMGINTGSIKHFSQWIAQKKYTLIDSVARTNITLYLIIGVVNAVILLILAFWGEGLFKVDHIGFQVLQTLFIIQAIYSILNWSTAVFNQLLIANEKIGYIQQLNIGKTILQLGLVFIALCYKMTLIQYFFFYLLINACIIIPCYLKVKSTGFITSIKPGMDWKNFKPVFSYSMAIFAMGLFQFTAMQSRPIILGIFTTTGIEILSEYRIIEVFPIFVISIGGMITSILLPKSSRLVYEGNKEKISELAYKGTLFTSIIVCFLSFPIIVVSIELLTLYVGVQYAYLAPWLSLWLLTIVLYLHNSPVASLVLATGKTRILVFSSAIACTISILINAFLCQRYGVGSAVIGYLVYIIIQMSFFYFYFNNKVLGLKSWIVFKSFIVPTIIAFFLMIVIHYLRINMNSLLMQIIIKSLLWVVGYIICLILFKVVKVKELINMLKK